MSGKKLRDIKKIIHILAHSNTKSTFYLQQKNAKR